MSFGLIATQTAPEGVLTQLREIDPKADLVHLGAREGSSEWLLGVYGENVQAKQRIEDELAALQPMTGANLGHHDVATKAYVDVEMSKQIELLQYCARTGFRPIHLYDTTEMTFGEIVLDFRKRDHNWRTRRNAAVQELKDAASFEKADEWRNDVMVDFMETEGLGIYDKVFRGAKHFAQRVAAPFMRGYIDG